MKKISTKQTRKKGVLMLVTIFLLLLVLPVVSAQDEVAPLLTANRCIISPEDDITPGSTFTVVLILNVNQNVSQFELDEEIPAGWTVACADNAGAIFDASGLKWTWPSVRAGETKTVSYDVIVPSTTTKGSYPISGKISAANATATSVGGELAVTVTTPVHKIPGRIAVFAGAVILAIFVLMIGLGFWADKKLDKGEIRRAIAVTLVAGFSILAVLSFVFDILRVQIVTAFIELVGIVVGFYFGVRTAAEKRAEATAKIGIEHVKFDAAAPKKIMLTVRNGGDSEIKVDKIYVNEDAYETDVKIDPQKSKEIKHPYEWKYKTEYKLKIATSTGLTADIIVSSPKEKAGS